MNYLYLSGRVILMVLVLQVFCQTVYSQEIIVSGMVLNEQNQPVSGAEVRLGKSNTKSNSRGSFLLKLTEFPAQLTVKHSQYKSYLEVVRAPVHKSDTIFLAIVLEGKETELEEVSDLGTAINRLEAEQRTLDRDLGRWIDTAQDLEDRRSRQQCAERLMSACRREGGDEPGESVHPLPELGL